jgi:hypothetical protein
LPVWLAEHAAAAVHRIEESGELDEATRAALLSALRDLSDALASSETPDQSAEAER